MPDHWDWVIVRLHAMDSHNVCDGLTLEEREGGGRGLGLKSLCTKNGPTRFPQR